MSANSGAIKLTHYRRFRPFSNRSVFSILDSPSRKATARRGQGSLLPGRSRAGAGLSPGPYRKSPSRARAARP